MTEVQTPQTDQIEAAPVSEQQQLETIPDSQINTAINRVYFTNIPSDVSETILADFLKEYKPTSVLIPYQHVTKYSGRKVVVPLGLAYVNFETADIANQVVSEVNNKSIGDSNKKLKLKLFEAYDPEKSKNAQSRLFKHFNKSAPSIQVEDNPPSQDAAPAQSLEASEANEETEGIPENSESHQQTIPIKYSKNWIYVSKLVAGTLDTDLAEHFKEFLPNDIYLFQFKSKKHRGKFFQKTHLSAIINLPSVEGIDNVAADVSSKTHLSKLKNVKISVQPCIEKKVTEVIEASKINEPAGPVEEPPEHQPASNSEETLA